MARPPMMSAASAAPSRNPISRSASVGGPLPVTPSEEVRGGDPEANTGTVIGGRFAFTDTVTGLSLDLRGRTPVVPHAEGFTDPDTSGRDGRTEFPPHPTALAAVPRGRRGTAPWPRPVTMSRLTTPVRERGWRTRRAFGSSSPDPNLLRASRRS